MARKTRATSYPLVPGVPIILNGFRVTFEAVKFVGGSLYVTTRTENPAGGFRQHTPSAQIMEIDYDPDYKAQP